MKGILALSLVMILAASGCEQPREAAQAPAPGKKPNVLLIVADAAASGATIFEYGALSPAPTVFPLFAALKKGLIVRGYTLFEIVNDTERLARGKQYIYDGLESGALSPCIDRTFPLDAIVDAHRYMESNEQKGKIVVTV